MTQEDTMLDPKFIRENIEVVAKGAKDKGFPFSAEDFAKLYDSRSALLQETEELRRQRNEGSKAVKGAKDKEEREGLLAKMKEVGQSLSVKDKELKEVEEQLKTLMLRVPSPASEDTPFGETDADNKLVRTVGEKTEFGFKAKDHITLGKELGIVDFERGTKVAGSRSYFLAGAGAELEWAIFSMALDLLRKRGYRQMTVPTLVRSATMEGTGYLPIGANEAYHIEKDDLWLVGTSEVSLASYHSGEILEKDQLPVKMAAFSPCYRREAGAHGKDTKGLYRVHQFQKIEQVILCEPNIEQSDALHKELLQNAEDLLQMLELPYQVMAVCTGDLGLGQVKKHDIETWMPSREKYGETHSCSSFYDFQSRRLKIRVRDENGKPQLVYTLNNTAVANTRVILAFLENHQTEDGNVRIPKALQPYLGGRELLV